jgi:hypothetical protein
VAVATSQGRAPAADREARAGESRAGSASGSKKPYLFSYPLADDGVLADATWPGPTYFTGQIDEVPVYGTELSAQQVAWHYHANH